ncbi:hypothetical protein AMECASPLE_035498 [Ameca splendens]|uniref:Uncharacterized protein n=1 Tax=Ameca splendens TaxID=208324 RepID=A0ABV0Y790_9TELE
MTGDGGGGDWNWLRGAILVCVLFWSRLCQFLHFNKQQGRGRISTSSPYIALNSLSCCCTHEHSSEALSAWSMFWLVPPCQCSELVGPKCKQALGSHMVQFNLLSLIINNEGLTEIGKHQQGTRRHQEDNK